MKSNQSQTVNITIPKALLKQVDELAERDYTSRSDIIRQALLNKVRSEKLDEWGDPVSENWKTVIDFRQHGYPDGIPGKEFASILQELNGQDK